MGTTLSVLGLYLITLGVTSTSFSGLHIGQILATWIACISGNIYIVGLNQLEDIDIDNLLDNWYKTKQEISVLEEKCEKYKNMSDYKLETLKIFIYNNQDKITKDILLLIQ